MPRFVIFTRCWLLLVSLSRCLLEWKRGSVVWAIMECSFRVEWWCIIMGVYCESYRCGMRSLLVPFTRAEQTVKRYQHLSHVVCLIVFRKPSTSFLCSQFKEVATFKVIVSQTFVLHDCALQQNSLLTAFHHLLSLCNRLRTDDVSHWQRQISWVWLKFTEWCF